MNTTNNAVTITGNGNIVAVINGKNFTATPDHPNYQKLLTNARAYDFDQFVKNYDLVANVSMYISGDVQIKDATFIYKGHVIHNTLTKRIINFMRNDLPFLPLVKLFENLLQNPSMRTVNELYDFLDLGELPITTDGHFLAYKNVKADYKDIHSGTFDNSVGSICEMPRNLVDEDKDRTCSKGLHFCSIKYLPHFADSNGGHTMIVKINPKDVVAIPADYNNTKGRTCRYEVIGEYTEDWRSKLKNNESGWDAHLYDEDGNEYEDEDEQTYCDKCGDDLTTSNYDGNGDLLCETCYDDEYSGCCGGGCHGKTTNEDEETNPNDCDENHCFCDKVDEHGDIKCDMDQNQVGNQGNDHLAGGTNSDYGVKPNGQKFHNLRDALGRFFSKKTQN
jgi:hypothetical protein